MGIAVGTAPCPECRESGRDSAGDNLVLYKDEDGNDAGAYCHACTYTVSPNSVITRPKENKLEDTKESKVITEAITEDERKELLESTTSAVNYRGIRKDTAAYFGVRYSLDDNEEVQKMYYPVTSEGKIVGYKVRKHPKEFLSPLGYVGKLADFGGQFRFKTNTRDVIICGGEIDQLSAYQMLDDYRKRSGKGHFEATAVVTSVIGENGTVSQAVTNYSFLSQFNRIIICLDNDEAGRAATEKLISKLPKGKVFLMNLEFKDPNEYIQKNMEHKFIDAFFKVRQHVPAGIVSSSDLYDKLLETAILPKIPLPPFLSKLQEMMAGGIPLKYIVNIGAGTGAAKTTVINECIRYWILHSPYKVGIVSCELDSGQYAEALLSRHLERKISLIESPEEKLAYLESEYVKKAANELFMDEFGSERFSLVDDRNGTISQVKDVIEEMIITCNCQLIVLDPIQDLIGNMSNEEQGDFMNWQKGLLKQHGVTIINVSHLKKRNGPADTEELVMPTEEDFHGSSTIIKSGGCNILMARNKYAVDPVERNTTHLLVSKLRWTGKTGPAGKLYYDNEKHTLYDFDAWVDGTAYCGGL